MSSNPVYIRGLQVGAVDDLEESNRNLTEVIVAIKLTKDINIPKNSLASISSSPLGSSSMEITLGNSKDYLKSGDTIQTSSDPSLLGDLTSKVGPVVDQVKVTLGSLDSVLRNMNSIFDPYTKNNVQSTIANLNRATASLVVSSAYLQDLMNSQSGSLARSLDNVNTFTRTLQEIMKG
jgi:phospholipid/cholesterol/gamma-HCH transport system substrate-binding protein